MVGAWGEGKSMRSERTSDPFIKALALHKGARERAQEFILSWEAHGKSIARKRHGLIYALKGSLLAASWRGN